MKKLFLSIVLLVAALTAPVAWSQNGRPAESGDANAAMRLAAIDQAEKQQAVERERQDLSAQQSMARSASKLLLPSWWQVGIGAFGLVGLLVSLGFTAVSLRQTRTALKVQRTDATAHMRAYLGVEGAILNQFGLDAAPVVRLNVKNYGQTPAYDVTAAINVKVLPRGAEPNYSIPVPDPMMVINPGQLSIFSEEGLLLTKDLFDQFVGKDLKGSAAVTCVCEMKYTTLGKRTTTQWACVFYGAGATSTHILTDFSRSD